MGTVKLDDADLDDEDRQILAELNKKGYYHGRPRSEATPAPQRIDGDAPVSSASRTEFDDYQRKWDKFGDDKYLRSLEPKAQKAPKKRKPAATSAAPSAGSTQPSKASPQAAPTAATPGGEGAGPWAAGFKS
mmetsp:Transcript_110006/g.350880  ORF Transcript_110006/g.350880 Transcript_110006/m.350880 type:complete len:132 (-) Transcript_110006:363-758(-)